MRLDVLDARAQIPAKVAIFFQSGLRIRSSAHVLFPRRANVGEGSRPSEACIASQRLKAPLPLSLPGPGQATSSSPHASRPSRLPHRK